MPFYLQLFPYFDQDLFFGNNGKITVGNQWKRCPLMRDMPKMGCQVQRGIQIMCIKAVVCSYFLLYLLKLSS